MKQPKALLFPIFGTVLCTFLLLTGCGGGSGSNAPGDNGLISSPFFMQPSTEVPSPSPQESLSPVPQESLSPVPQESLSPVPQESLSPVPQESLSPVPQESLSPVPQAPTSSVPQTPPGSDAAAFVGTWIHTYEYFDVTYHTTLVIDANGTAVYYNEETELGNFSATWQLTSGYLSMSRSDGVSSVLALNGNTLVETTYEDGDAYQAEYVRG